MILSFESTNCVPDIWWLNPEIGSVTVAVPFVETSTVLPLFAAWTLSFTSLISAGFKFVTFVTSVIAGTTGVKSLYVTSFGSLGWEILPASSIALAIMFPAGKSRVGSIVTFPRSSVVFSPIFRFLESKISTFALGSELITIGILVPAFSNNGVSIIGFDGAVLSKITLPSNLASPFCIDPFPWWLYVMLPLLATVTSALLIPGLAFS